MPTSTRRKPAGARSGPDRAGKPGRAGDSSSRSYGIPGRRSPPAVSAGKPRTPTQAATPASGDSRTPRGTPKVWKPSNDINGAFRRSKSTLKSPRRVPFYPSSSPSKCFHATSLKKPTTYRNCIVSPRLQPTYDLLRRGARSRIRLFQEDGSLSAAEMEELRHMTSPFHPLSVYTDDPRPKAPATHVAAFNLMAKSTIPSATVSRFSLPPPPSPADLPEARARRRSPSPRRFVPSPDPPSPGQVVIASGEDGSPGLVADKSTAEASSAIQRYHQIVSDDYGTLFGGGSAAPVTPSATPNHMAGPEAPDLLMQQYYEKGTMGNAASGDTGVPAQDYVLAPSRLKSRGGLPAREMAAKRRPQTSLGVSREHSSRPARPATAVDTSRRAATARPATAVPRLDFPEAFTQMRAGKVSPYLDQRLFKHIAAELSKKSHCTARVAGVTDRVAQRMRRGKAVHTSRRVPLREQQKRALGLYVYDIARKDRPVRTTRERPTTVVGVRDESADIQTLAEQPPPCGRLTRSRTRHEQASRDPGVEARHTADVRSLSFVPNRFREGESNTIPTQDYGTKYVSPYTEIMRGSGTRNARRRALLRPSYSGTLDKPVYLPSGSARRGQRMRPHSVANDRSVLGGASTPLDIPTLSFPEEHEPDLAERAAEVRRKQLEMEHRDAQRAKELADIAAREKEKAELILEQERNSIKQMKEAVSGAPDDTQAS